MQKENPINKPMKNMTELSPLSLAYIGDGVFELLVRSMILSDKPAKELHEDAKSYVCAEAQAKMYFKIIDLLDEEERAVLKRGRNAKTASRKSCRVTDYHHATALEALFGYLYLMKRTERIEYLFKICTEEAAGNETAQGGSHAN